MTRMDGNLDGWTRHGECNHCGWCCQHTGQVLARVSLSPTADVAFYRLRGFTLTHEEGVPVLAERLADVKIPCEWHVDHRCQDYAHRPQTCLDFPTRPAQIEHTPCSFWFRHDDGRVLCGAPYPKEESDGTLDRASNDDASDHAREDVRA